MHLDSSVLWQLAITLTLACTTTSDDRLQLFREACPYSTFCTTDSRQPSTQSNNTMPCCLDCFCDEYCALFNDCCPDVEPNRSKFNNTTISCRPTLITTSAIGNQFQLVKPPGYRFIDFCPPDFKGNIETVEKCEGDLDVRSELDEAVLVSDNGGMIYRNRHCAVCHGVSEIHSWNLIVSVCSEEIEMKQLVQADMMAFLLDHCILISERPAHIPVTARTLECDDVDTCLNNNMDQNEVDACLNGPFMPYMDYKPGRAIDFTIQKNVYCYKCTGGLLGSGICRTLNELEGASKVNILSYEVLLNLDSTKKGASSARQWKCHEVEIFDTYTENCRRLLCPPFHLASFGKCIPFASPNNAYAMVRVVYTMPNNITVVFKPDELNMYNESMVQQHLKQVAASYRYKHCKIVIVALSAILDRSTNTFIRVVLGITYQTTEQCSMTYIGQYIRHGQSKLNQATWMLHGKSYVMDGQVTFYNDPPLLYNPMNSDALLLYKSTAPLKINPLNMFFVCPYVILNHKEYVDHVERSGKKGTEYDIQFMSPSSRYLEGFFPLSENDVAACVQDYVQKSSAFNIKLETASLALGVFLQIFNFKLI